MKTLIVIFALSMLALGCTETIEVEKRIRDTVFIKSPPVMSFVQTVHVDTVYKELVRVDTVSVTVVVHDTTVIVNNVVTVRIDTVVQIKTDSIFIERVVEKIVNHFDTVIVERIITSVDTVYIDKIVHVTDTVYVTEYEQLVIYTTEFVFPGRSVFFVPDDLLPIYQSFFEEATKRGLTLNGGSLIIQYAPSDQIPGEGWVSNYAKISGDQNVIYIDENLIVENSKSPIFREMGRWQLGKKYTTAPDKIMNPLLDPSHVVTKLQIDELFKR